MRLRSGIGPSASSARTRGPRRTPPGCRFSWGSRVTTRSRPAPSITRCDLPCLLASRHGGCGAELSNLLPNLSTVVDDIAIVRSMQTTQFNHAPAQLFMSTGRQIASNPSLGAWLTYGIGSESKDLPGFVVMLSGQNAPDGGRSCWGSGFLPSVY